MQLFVYGTLVDPQIAEMVIGRHPDFELGHINDFQTVYVHGQLYPTLAQAPGVSLPGKLYKNLTELEFERIEFYEGDEYIFLERPITLDSKLSFLAGLYFPIKEPDSSQLWDYQEWCKLHKSNYLKEVKEFMFSKEAMDLFKNDPHHISYQK